MFDSTAVAFSGLLFLIRIKRPFGQSVLDSTISEQLFNPLAAESVNGKLFQRETANKISQNQQQIKQLKTTLKRIQEEIKMDYQKRWQL